MERTTQQAFRCWMVDDSPSVLLVMAKFLQELAPSWQFSAFESGQALLDALESQTAPDLLILDLHMEGIDGIELLRHLSHRNISFRLVICSGAPVRLLHSVSELCRTAGLPLIGSLLKPVTVQAIHSLIRMVQEPLALATSTRPIGQLQVHEVIRALQQHQFYCVYQPIIRLKDNKLTGIEMLGRCAHPSRGLVPPDDFIASLEKYGLIAEHTFEVLNQALQDLRNWNLAGLPLDMSINLSAQMLTDLSLPEKLTKLVERHQIPPQQIHLEITEGCFNGETAVRLEILNRLVLRGFHLSIDDFGTSFSSLERLHELPFDTVKLDKKFIQRALHDEGYRASVESTLMMAHRLHMQIIAEGIETLEGWTMIHNSGCDACQGYYVARPMTGDQLLAWSEQWQLQHQ